MEVVIPILAATGLILAGKNNKKQNNDMLNRESMQQAKESEKASDCEVSNLKLHFGIKSD